MSMHWPRRAVPLALALLAFAGCAARGGAVADAAGRSNARPAALARLTVENRSARPLTIAFRAAAANGAEVVVGSVAAGATAELAPVPAGEPIVLIARTPDGAELRLAPRTFELDEAWRWLIPADAAFQPGDAEP